MGFSLQILMSVFFAAYLALAGMIPGWISSKAADPGGHIVQDDALYLPLLARAGTTRGYLTTPQELAAIKGKIARGSSRTRARRKLFLNGPTRPGTTT